MSQARVPTALAALLLLASTPRNVPADEPPVTARIATPLATAGDAIRQYAFDGDPVTAFASEAAPGADDTLTLSFARPVATRSIRVLTGRADGTQALTTGTLEVSADGATFERVADLDGAEVRVTLASRPVQAVRIRPGADTDHPLVVREIEVDSDPRVATFRTPVEFRVDVADAPEMREWAEKAARVCEENYSMIAAELASDGYTPARVVTMALKPDYKGVAATGGTHIVGSVRYFQDHPDDVGAMVHEAVHVVQRYRGRGNPGWLVEGVADYVRFFKYEPGHLGRIDPRRARYDGSYRVTAAFLDYLCRTHDAAIVRKLNAAMREGKYREELFQEWTGKPLPELGEEWHATLDRAAGR